MNKNKKQLIFTALITAILCISYYGCGTDDVTNTPVGPPPSINMKPGSTYDFTYDSLTTTRTIRLPRMSHDVVLPLAVLSGKNCYPIISTTTDSVTHAIISVDTSYFSYDSTGGKFYQYGIVKLINPNSTSATWDLAADFSVPQGTQWTIGQVDYIVTIGGTPYHFTGPLTAKVAEQTSIQTTGSPSVAINCYRIEMYTHVTGNGVAADIYVDYYLGYASTSANPSGLVEAKLRPFSIVSGSTVIFNEPGGDRKLKSFTIAP